MAELSDSRPGTILDEGLEQTERQQPVQLIIAAERIEQLKDLFARTWMRPPTAKELTGLIDDEVREELLYHEALALGMDPNDVVIRRLAQRMQALAEEYMPVETPTEAELNAYLHENPGKYAIPALVSFRHIFFSKDRRGDAARDDARTLLVNLQANDASDIRPQEYGDRFALQYEYRRASQAEIWQQFGEGFARAVMELPPGSWQGPGESGYGLHLVRVDVRLPLRVPELDEVCARVLDDLVEARMKQNRDAYLQGLRAKYRVVVDASVGEGPAPCRDVTNAGGKVADVDWPAVERDISSRSARPRGHVHGASRQRSARSLPPDVRPSRYRDGRAVSNAPMGSAPMRYDENGQVAWDQMWDHF